MEITKALIEQLFIYSKDEGRLYNRVARGRRVKVGLPAGTVRSDGYVKICINRKPFYEHRLIWLLETGKFPEGVVDHINQNTSDNRFENLRDTNHSVNAFNRGPSKCNSLNQKNIRKNKSGSYLVEMSVNGKCRYFGSFTSLEEAMDKRNELKELYKD